MDLMDLIDLAIFKCLGRSFTGILAVLQKISENYYSRYILLSMFQCTDNILINMIQLLITINTLI